MSDHKDLVVWKESIELVTEVYEIASILPESEKYGLTSQIKRSSVSIPSNLAEVAGRLSTKEYIRFLHICSGSLSELETQMILLRNLGYIDSFHKINSRIKRIRFLLFRLKKGLCEKLAK